MNAQGIAIAPGQYAKKYDDSSVLITQGGESTVVPFHSMLHPLEDNNHFSIWVSGLCSFSGKKELWLSSQKNSFKRREAVTHTNYSLFITQGLEKYLLLLVMLLSGKKSTSYARRSHQVKFLMGYTH